RECAADARVGFRSRPSEDPHSFAFHVRTNIGRQAGARRIANFHTVIESFLERLVDLHEWQETKISTRSRVNKDIHVRVRVSLIARVRTEQIKRPDSDGPQCGLGLFQSGDDLISAHSPQYSAERDIFQQIAIAYCSRTIWPLAYSKRFSFDRNESPSRF